MNYNTINYQVLRGSPKEYEDLGIIAIYVPEQININAHYALLNTKGIEVFKSTNLDDIVDEGKKIIKKHFLEISKKI
ncbi:MAG TPA: hypothetical protein P5277_01615 [Candidatus Paceibacterota bacterium]|nr:hypothetical protein [Candidatus Paceibacterota bacterium]